MEKKAFDKVYNSIRGTGEVFVIHTDIICRYSKDGAITNKSFKITNDQSVKIVGLEEDYILIDTIEFLDEKQRVLHRYLPYERVTDIVSYE